MSASNQQSRMNPTPSACLPLQAIAAADVAHLRLRSNGYLALKGISCDCHEGLLILRGQLPSYFLKQMAQTVLGTIDGVEYIDNQIEVVAHLPQEVDASPTR